MSGGSAPFTDTAIHGKLEPPRSLHGVEDAEIIWDTITRRFPNAAPLLCEMEAVIERAEDLLQQLKTPCAQENDTSSSFHTPHSQESNTTISMVSDIESFAEEINVTENAEVTEVETQFMTHGIREQQVDLELQRGEQSVQREQECFGQGYHLNSPRTLDEVVQHIKTDLTHKCCNSQGESDANVTDSGDKGIDVSSEEKLEEPIMRDNSLEGWIRVVNAASRKHWHNSTENIYVFNDNDAKARPNVNRNIDNCLLTVNSDNGYDKSDIHNSNKTDDVKVIKNDLQDNIEKSSVTSCRPPFIVLEEYAKRCKVSVKYEYKPKSSNLYVTNGDLCGFRAMSCATTPYLAKSELAAKILWMIAERQMDDSKLSSSICGLSDFSREEMLEIMDFNKEQIKNASQKLYKFCLEKEKPIPKYSIRNLKTNQGFMYTAQCTVLDHVGVGQGLRKDSAKIAAAENLYQKYHDATNNLSK